ncbi:MAG: UMP kinase [Candidatus Aenigmarchaeota archaeon]|nr:UMP kinase [Candidatus Aenigmarchaeota archaeon]MCX8190715.1 UMP kinase [Candidatus Aenigmarchaeota archaeon]MDW8159963.1 UMP kinase [Candidatus Aenigmarchaeota archaeon]
MKVVISIGGSLLTKKISYENFKKYAKVIENLSKKHSLIVVCGGGKIARKFINIAKAAKADEEIQDFIGIMATHLNASTLASIVRNSYLVKWKPLKETENEIKKHFGRKIIIAAGYDTGHSTDYNAAYFASLVKADIVINATDVDGVYDKDPKIFKNARKYNSLNFDDFIKIISKLEQSPGKYSLFDLEAAKILKKEKIKLVILNGKDPKNILSCLNGKQIGTTVL